MGASANYPGTLKSFFRFIFRIWNLDFAAGDYSPITFRLNTLAAFTFTGASTGNLNTAPWGMVKRGKWGKSSSLIFLELCSLIVPPKNISIFWA